MSETERTLQVARAAIADLKGIDPEYLNVSKFTAITDVMVIVSGRSNRHVKAIAEEVQKQAKHAKLDILGVEGAQEGEWILVDLSYVIVHIMQPRVRDFYKLEKLWGMEDGSEQQNGAT